MKTILTIVLFILSVNAFSQAGWVSIGSEIGYNFFYKKDTIVRNDKTFVVIVGVPIQEQRDFNNVKIKYVTADIIFYQSTAGIRSIIGNHIYFYDDGTFKKAGLPRRDMPVTYYNTLLKLYNEIK